MGEHGDVLVRYTEVDTWCISHATVDVEVRYLHRMTHICNVPCMYDVLHYIRIVCVRVHTRMRDRDT